MTTYRVTDTPTQIVLGENGTDYSISNDGPSTVYLESNTSLTTLSGIALPPMGVMTWNSSTPLWAVCQDNQTSSLQVNLSAGRLDTSRAKFFSQLSSTAYTGNPVSYSIPTVECSHCETLLLNIVGVDPGNTSPPWYWLRVAWYDQNQNQISADSIEVFLLQKSSVQGILGTILIRLPVEGSFFSASILPQTPIEGGSVAPIQNITVYGSDRRFPFSYWCTNQDLSSGVVLGFATGVGSQNGSGDNVGFNLTSPYGNLYFAGLSQRVGVFYSASGITTAGNRRYRTETTVPLADIPITTGTSSAYTEFVLPTKRLVYQTNVSGLTGGTLIINHNYLMSGSDR